MLVHSPTSLFARFPLLLKKLRLLHDIHLLKFMTESKTFGTKKKEKRKEKKKEQTNPEQEDKVMVVEEE